MVLNLKKYIINFLIVIVLFGVIHVLFLYVFPVFIGISSKILLQIYGFLFLLNLLNFLALKWLFSQWPRYAGYLFTALSMFKMALCILFLIPYIFPSNIHSVSLVFNFMAVYLIALFFEVVYIAKNMNGN